MENSDQQAHATIDPYQAMTDPNMAEETVGLLGEEVRAQTAGQQALRLG